MISHTLFGQLTRALSLAWQSNKNMFWILSNNLFFVLSFHLYVLFSHIRQYFRRSFPDDVPSTFKGLSRVGSKDAVLKEPATRSVSRPCRYAKSHSAVFFQRVEPSQVSRRRETGSEQRQQRRETFNYVRVACRCIPIPFWFSLPPPGPGLKSLKPPIPGGSGPSDYR